MKNQTKKRHLLASIGSGALALALSASPAFAQGGSDQAGMPSSARSATVHASGTITGIDKSSRIVTIKTDTGELRSFQVPSEVSGFDKLKKGDKVAADYTESIAVAMQPKGTKLTASERAAATKTGAGMGGAGKQITISAEVISVDAANNTVTLKGPKGNVETIDVKDPENQAKLPSIKPGQVMQFTYTEAVAVAVTPQGK
jgi:Cu/Ag efflux protein CusF